ncbi:hypothetical protein [Tateyamaria sp. SN6-1]|uniref:hypothetical protein n=1 Tax=Tateyamaria sp. SN6-1 TaxID=3092148 RepID=UPI0039F58BA7
MTASTGGDVDLSGMPAPRMAALRYTRRVLAYCPLRVIRKDLNPGTLLCDDIGHFALVDRDEARVDAICFGSAAIGQGDAMAAGTALAWEIACCRALDLLRARRLAQGVMTSGAL